MISRNPTPPSNLLWQLCVVLTLASLMACPITPPNPLGKLKLGSTSGLGSKNSENSTVNVISQNAVETSQNSTEMFLQRLERKDIISKIQGSIEKLRDKLGMIKTSVGNRLNRINISGLVSWV